MSSKVEEMAMQYGMAALLEPRDSLADAGATGAEESQAMLWQAEDTHEHVTMSQWSEACASIITFCNDLLILTHFAV